MPSVHSVTVIVPVWNRAQTIGATIRSILAQSYPPELVEIIFVDNGSSDDSLDILKKFDRVLTLQQLKCGSYAARNKGLDYATGEYVAFTDADCIAAPDWLERAIYALERDRSIGVIAGRVEVVPSPGGARLAYLIERETAFKQKENAQRGVSVTANWVSRRSVIEEAGRFDDKLKSGGDWVLSKKLSAAGLRTVYCGDVIVRHPSRSGVIDLLQKRRRVAGGVWARRKTGLPRLILAEVAGGARRAVELGRSTKLTRFERASVLPIVFLSAAISVGELLRLALGGTPRRS